MNKISILKKLDRIVTYTLNHALPPVKKQN